jgi:hypothetical protein
MARKIISSSIFIEYYATMREAIRSSCMFSAILMTFVLNVIPAGDIIRAFISFNSSIEFTPVFSGLVLLLLALRSTDF